MASLGVIMAMVALASTSADLQQNISTEFVEGGTLKVTWKDCGDSTYHAKVTKLAPTSITLGQTTSIVGSGTIDEQLSGGSYTINAKFGPVTENWSGEACSAKTFTLPLGIGKITWDGVKCPQAAGPVSVGVDVELSSFIPAAAASGTILIKATDDKSANLMCLQMDVSGGATENVMGTGPKNITTSLATSATSSAPGKLLYSADFTKPLDLVAEVSLLDKSGKKRERVPTEDWVLESGKSKSRVEVSKKGMTMKNNDQHMVLWLNRRFPADVEFHFGVMPKSVAKGLNIVFFAATPLKGTSTKSIFDLALEPRNGDYKNYNSDNHLAMYGQSYFRDRGCAKPTKIGSCAANLRKDPGQKLVSEGVDLITNQKPKNKVFEVVVKVLKGEITISVDGKEETKWKDSKPIGGGYIGFRQMLDTAECLYTHFDVYSLSDVDSGVFVV
jgi:hypothetical protein